MFGFLGFILLFIFLIVLIGLALIGNIIRMIFGLGRRSPKQYHETRKETYSSTNQQQTAHSNTPSANKKKIFGEDEGEYVEFEEVK